MSKFSISGLVERTLRADATNPYLLNSNEYWMCEALLASMNEIGKASPNPTVGCVFVKEGKLISAGATQEYGSLHGERYAASLVEDKSLLEGSTVYVTLEPCSHFGKQPPCSDLLIELKVSKVYVSMIDPFSEVKGKGIEKLKAAGIEVQVGLLEKESYKWHLPFIMSLKKEVSFIYRKMGANSRWSSSR